MSKLNEILADVKTEGTDPFADMEKANPAESQPAKELVEDKADQGEPAKPAANTEENEPFHKRWADREKKLKADLQAEYDQKLESFKKEIETKIVPSEKSSIPDWFQTLYGDNEEAWQKYSDHSKAEREAIKQEFLAEQEAKRTQAEQESKKWDKWVDDSISGLQTEGLQFDKNKLIKVMIDYSPTDEKGNLDFRKGLKILENLEPKEDVERSKARKAIADISTKSTAGEKKSKDYMTPADLRGKSWNKI